MINPSDKNIFTFWDSQLDKSPLVVQMSAYSWEKVTDGTAWKVHYINETNVDAYEEQVSPENKAMLQEFRSRFKAHQPHWSWTHYTDCLRLALLSEFGGIWADGTVCTSVAPEKWIPHFDSLLLPRGGNLVHEMNSWFITSPSRDKLLQTWCREFLDYCKDGKLRSQILHSPNKLSADFWLKKFSRLHPGLNKFWFSPLVKSVFRIAPYFAIYYMFSKVRRYPELRVPIWQCHLPLDVEAWKIFNDADWLNESPKGLKKRLLTMPIIKLCYKSNRGVTDVDSIPEGCMLDDIFRQIDSDWRKVMRERYGPHT